MQIGDLRTRARLEARQERDDGAGGSVVSFVTVGSLWVNVRTDGGTELVQAKKRNAKVTHLVVARWRSNLLPSMRLVIDATVLDIQWVADPDGRRRELQLFCEEVLSA